MKSKKLAIALASAVAFLSGCGSSNNGSNAAGVGPNIVGCAQYGTNGSCLVPIYATTGGCVPISQPIYFGGTGMTNGYELQAQSAVTGASTSNGAIAVSTTAVTSAGGIQAWTSPSGLTLYETRNGTTGLASVYGQMTLSSAVQQNLAMYYGSTSATCVSGIALDVLASYPSVYGVTGVVYLYLNNNTASPYPVRLY